MYNNPQASVQSVSFNNLHSINNKHPGLIGNTTSAVRCLKCLNVVVVSPCVRTEYINQYGHCKCTNVGILLDDQSTLRVYVEDLNSIHIGSAILNSSNDIVDYFWGDYSEEHILAPYFPIKNTGVTFAPSVRTEKPKVTKKSTPYVNTLTESLDLGSKAQGRLFYYNPKD